MSATPWAILLCKFKDKSDEPHSVDYFKKFFTQTGAGTSNMTDFYTEASHGALDLSGNKVIGWYQLDKNLSDYKGSGANQSGRNDLVTWARWSW
jgi:M6 family metalloprotease-like protein